MCGQCGWCVVYTDQGTALQSKPEKLENVLSGIKPWLQMERALQDKLSVRVANRTKERQYEQVAQLSQRHRAAGWVSYRQKWKTGTGRQYLWTL